MKKVLFVLVVLALVFGSVMPVLAEGGETVETEGQVTASCDPPAYKGTRVYPADLNLWSGDPVNGTLWPLPGPAETPVRVYSFFDVIYANEISSAFVSVYHPDGTVKFPQVAMRRVLCEEAGQILAAWLARGLITETQRSEWLQNVCQNDWQLWCAEFPYEIHQIPGRYDVRVYVTGLCGGATQVGSVGFNIGAFVSLAIDFKNSGVNYGDIQPGQESWDQGDLNFDPDSSQNPTVWNQGNVNGVLSVLSTPLIPGDPWAADEAKWIVDFNVSLGQLDYPDTCVFDPNTGQHACQYIGEYPVEYYDANVWTAVPGVLYPCTPDKVSFSVEPPEDQVLPATTYTGDMTLAIEKAS